MQERARVSSMDLKAHMNKLRKNPKFTEEILKLVESDLQYGLSIEETEQYTNRRYDYAQMKAYSACLRNGYPEEVRNCITREGLTGEQMAVALEFYEKGVPVKTIAEITENSAQTAFTMKKLFQNVVSRVQEAGEVMQAQEGYAKDLLEQMKSVVEKIEFQEKRYDALNEQLQKVQTAGRDVEVENGLLKKLDEVERLVREKDRMLEEQQNELNEARAAVIRLRNEKDMLGREREKLEKNAAGKTVQEQTPAGSREDKDMSHAAVQEEKQESRPKIPDHPVFPGTGYHVAVVDGSGRIVSIVPMESTERKKENRTISALFSRLVFKKKINLVKLVAEKDLEPKQLVQIRSAIEKGLSEEQLLVLINNRIPAEQMEEIINIAVYENKQKQEV